MEVMLERLQTVCAPAFTASAMTRRKKHER